MTTINHLLISHKVVNIGPFFFLNWNFMHARILALAEHHKGREYLNRRI